MLTDAHLHLTELNDAGAYPGFGSLEMVFSCTARREEWENLASIEDARVKRFYGIHPWYAGEWDEESKEELLSLLDADPSAGVGEIGLDSKHGGVPLQRKVFEEQLDIASEYGRTVTVHMVGCENEVLESVRGHAKGVPVILHAFKSESYAKPFCEAGCYFSIGPRLLAKSRENVSRILSAIPGDRILVESDAPHFPKTFGGMGKMVSEMAEIMGVSEDWLISKSYENLRRIA